MFLSDQQRPNPCAPAERDKHQRTFWGKDLIAKFSWESKIIFDYSVTLSRFRFGPYFAFLLFLTINSEELTRLWNLNPDNMEACKSDSRCVFGKHLLKGA